MKDPASIWQYFCLTFAAQLSLGGAHMGTHQRGFTQQLASSHQVANGDVEIGVAAAPVGDLGEGVSGQNVLQEATRLKKQNKKTSASYL